jgi:hypothetical protein
VLKKLDEVLHEANHTLMEHGVIPDLGMEGSKKGSKGARMAPRKDAISAFGTVEEQISEEDEESPELFSMMQNLLHTDEPQQPSGSQPETTPAAGADAIAGPVTGQPQGGNVEAALQQVTQQYMVPTNMVEAGTTAEGGAVMQAFQPAADQQVQMVDQSQLMSILTTIQKSLEVRETGTAASIPNHVDEIQKIDISGSLGEMLNQDGDDSVVNAVDRHSSDVINLVTLLYEAIWDDESVPIPIKELIGRTQITIMKVALTDQEFFNLEDHPARAILNEFAAAGIGWTEVEKLDEDPLYQKIEELVNKMLLDFDDEVSFFEDLIKDFRAFLASEAAKTRQLEQSILKAKERQDRLEDINELVTQKIDERILGRELHPFVSALLENQFHKFMVLLVLKEGPGSNAWRQAINTIDVLLWSIQIHDHDGDRERLETINPRLLNNLRKALRIASVESSEVDKLITALKEVQDETFVEEEVVEEEVVEEESPEDGILPLDLAQEQALADDDSAEAEEPSIPLLETVVEVSDEEPEQQADAAPVEQEKEAVEEEDFSEYLHQVDTLGVGMWVEFTGQDEINPRCKLAAKINAIDKFIFVNQQGVKVVEKTKLGLAKELKEGTVKIISDGLLFSRALESVIGNLRESQHREQTGSAYQPQSESQA